MEQQCIARQWIRYQRLVRIEDGDALNGVAAKLATKYGGAPALHRRKLYGTPEPVLNLETHGFELQPK